MNLEQIRIKIRRITRSPSPSQISDPQIDEYINRFLQFDFPANIKTFTYRDTLRFYTTPGIDTYETSDNPHHPLFDFKNRIVSVHPPVMVNGFQAQFSISRRQFEKLYPDRFIMQDISVGDGATIAYNGQLLQTPILRDRVIFSSIDEDCQAMVIRDTPRDGECVGDLIDLNGNNMGTINYDTGDYQVMFPNPPRNQQPVTIQFVHLRKGKPSFVLYFANKFVLRPVPDKVYEVKCVVYRQPSELLYNMEPELRLYGEYIAYGASKKIFEDRMDTDSLNAITPFFKEQERLVLRRTIMQQSDQRVATIYSDTTVRDYDDYY